MHKSKNDVLIGGIVIALVAGLSALAGGWEILKATAWLIGTGVLILFLLQLKRNGATLVAVVLMPMLILRKFFVPKKVRAQLTAMHSGEKRERK
ncbi:hypothetical protein [Janthinobacterium sp. RT4P48]|uniref:hypothetical protein n=1 Tax=Janthinobacterium sp. RT4P48 TaxID=3424188 RepID=UPI003F2713AE